MQLQCLQQLLIDSWYAAPAAKNRYLLPVPLLSSKQAACAAADDQGDRQTD